MSPSLTTTTTIPENLPQSLSSSLCAETTKKTQTQEVVESVHAQLHPGQSRSRSFTTQSPAPSPLSVSLVISYRTVITRGSISHNITFHIWLLYASFFLRPIARRRPTEEDDELHHSLCGLICWESCWISSSIMGELPAGGSQFSQL